MGGEWAVLGAIVLGIILYYLWKRKKPEKPPVKKKRRVVAKYEGWLVTWMPNYDSFPDVKGHHAMRLVYGIANMYNDGYIESVPDSFFMTYYQTDGIQRKFNPFHDQLLIRMYEAEQGKRVVFADGTEDYIAMLFGAGYGDRERPQAIAQDVMSMAGM